MSFYIIFGIAVSRSIAKPQTVRNHRMRTKKDLKFDEQIDREIEKARSKFSQYLMSNAKWVRLIDKLVENADQILKIQFKKVQHDTIGELFVDKDMTFGFDYWQEGFEECNSLGGPLAFKEIEYLIFPKKVDGDQPLEQDLSFMEALIKSVGHFDLEIAPNRIQLNCYRA